MARSSDIKKALLEKWVSESTDGKLLCDVQGAFSGNVVGDITGNANTVTNGVYTTGNQTIDGTKNFSSTIIGNISGNAGTVTNGVNTTGNQTIGGTKTFNSHIQVAGKYIYARTGFDDEGGNFTVIMGQGSGLSANAGIVIGGYIPHSSTSKVMAFYRLFYGIAQVPYPAPPATPTVGLDNDANGNILVYSTHSNGTAISTVGGGGGDQAVGYLDMAYKGTWYGVFTAEGVASKASDGKFYVKPIISWSDASTNYRGAFYNFYQSVTFLEMYNG
jgi:hypothetical protein